MKRLIGLLFVILYLVSAKTVYAGSGYESFPKTDYMKRKMGEDVDEQSGNSSLDRFYRWKQKSLEEQQEAAPSDVSTAEDAQMDDDIDIEEEDLPVEPKAATIPVSQKPVMVAPGVPMPQKGGYMGGADQTIPLEILDHPLEEEPIVEFVPANKKTDYSLESSQQPDITTSTEVAEAVESVPPLNTTEQNRITPDYVLGAGDVLEISVWKDETLSKIVPILPDGMIQFPLIGQVPAVGKNVTRLQQEIKDKMSKYMPNPFVDVSVKQVNSMMIYIIGKVHGPGRYVINANVNVLQALAMAGGLNTFAKGGKIRIIRETGGRRQILRFDYDEAVSGKDLSQNIQLERGDIIVVN